MGIYGVAPIVYLLVVGMFGFLGTMILRFVQAIEKIADTYTSKNT